MAEARAADEEESLREAREAGARRNPSSERNKPEQRLSSQGPLSSIRAAIKRTSRPATQTEHNRERRRPEITILSAEPLPSNSWFPGGSGAFPAAPPPAPPSWTASVLTVQLPPPSYEQVIREKSREHNVPTSSVSSSPSSSSSSSSPAPRRSTVTIATQTETEVSGSQRRTGPPVRRPPKPPRPTLPLTPKPAEPVPPQTHALIELDDSEPPSTHAPTPTHSHDISHQPLSEQCGVQTDESFVVGGDDLSHISHDPPLRRRANEDVSARPRPRPRSKVCLQPVNREDVLNQPMSREVKVQTLVRLKDDGTESVYAGFADSSSDSCSNKYLQELLDVFGYDEKNCQSDQQSESDQSENEEDPNSDSFLSSVPSPSPEPLKRPQPRPRTQNLKSPNVLKPSDPTQDKQKIETSSDKMNKQKVSPPIPAPRPLLKKASVSPQPSSSEEERTEMGRLPPAPKPPLAARRSRVPTQAEEPTTGGPKTFRKRDVDDQNSSSGSGSGSDVPLKPAPVNAGSVKCPAGPNQNQLASKAKPPLLRRPPPPAHTPAQVPASAANTTKAAACPVPSLPPRPSESRLLPLRPPPIKLNKSAATSQTPAPTDKPKICKAPKRGPPLPPRPKPGHPLYKEYLNKVLPESSTSNQSDSETQAPSFEKEELFVALDDTTPAQTPGFPSEKGKDQSQGKSAEVFSAASDEPCMTKEEKKPPPNSSVSYVARFAYEGEDDELTLREGDVVQLIEYVNEEWGRGRLEDGRTGLFPLNFVQIVPKNPAPESFAPPGGEMQKGRALYDFLSEAEDELSLKVGDVVHSLEEADDEWFVGEFDGKRGIVPKNYIQIL